MSRDNSRELTRKSTQGIFLLHLARLLILGDKQLGACVGQWGDSETPEGHANPKESREWRAEL